MMPPITLGTMIINNRIRRDHLTYTLASAHEVDLISPNTAFHLLLYQLSTDRTPCSRGSISSPVLLILIEI
jgi:hypothetical protein